MNDDRRQLMKLGLAALVVSAAAPQVGASPSEPVFDPIPILPPNPEPGRPGEFDFLAGEWRIHHRRLLKPGEWDVFEGEATCWTILKGVGSVEELRIPARDFSGMGLRLLDRERNLWSDHWVNAKYGVIGSPGVTGSFHKGAGIFVSDDVDNGKPIKAAGIWDNITAKSCRWRQAVSRDGGQSWEQNWIMEWTRAS
jgi:hypothetical protein